LLAQILYTADLLNAVRLSVPKKLMTMTARSNNARSNTSDYLALFLNDIPMMDVRAPVEFEKGSFPNSVNEPLMNDEERHLVGIRYKEKGQDSAIELGHELVGGETKAARLARWVAFTQAHPEGYLYCFRGGLRSRTTQGWIKEAGVNYPLVTGGSKAMRRFLIDELESSVESLSFRVLSGRTGTGKTRLLKRLPNFVDLEGLANHRGSSFGRKLTPQPSQIDFENGLSVALLKARHLRTGPVYIEDESRLIGRNALPEKFRDVSNVSQIVVLDAPLEERVDIVLQDYVIDMTRSYEAAHGTEQGLVLFSDYLLQSLTRISKRLGNEKFQVLESMMRAGIKQQIGVELVASQLERHREWIRVLLDDYYDPMYDYQLDKKSDRIIFKGDKHAILEWDTEQQKNETN